MYFNAAKMAQEKYLKGLSATFNPKVVVIPQIEINTPTKTVEFAEYVSVFPPSSSLYYPTFTLPSHISSDTTIGSTSQTNEALDAT